MSNLCLPVDEYVCISCNQVITTDVGLGPDECLFMWEECGLIENCDLITVNKIIKS